MPSSRHDSPFDDVCLLLRCHGEQLYLGSQVAPVLDQLERPGAVPEEQLGAALAYLELLWIDASRRATETEAALAALRTGSKRPLRDRARRYHAAVRRQRECLALRVALRLGARPRTAPGGERSEHAAL